MLGERLQSFVDEIVAAEGGPSGCIVAVSQPDCPVVSAHSGFARRDNAVALGPDTPFHIASVGKMITATLVHQLSEEGAFGPAGVDTTLPELRDRSLLHPTIAAGVHPQADRITLRHLLSHTSGMKDMQVDDATTTAAQLGVPAPESIQARYWRSVRNVERGHGDDGFARHLWRMWDPDHPDDPMAGHLNRFLATGTASSPVADPGDVFHYSDTAYVLLGLIIEAARGTTYHDAQRTHVLDVLGMQSTYLAGYDDPSADARSHEMDVWVGDVPLLSEGFSLSFDWGGGGQVSTVGDLLRLVRGVAAGTCFGSADTRRLMLSPITPAGLALPRVGIGLGVHHLLLGDRPVVGHAGAWGVRVFLDLSTDIAIASTVGRRDDCVWLPDLFALAEDQ
jgi:D-alanyl-D-alanine carboxypeptidase